MNRMNTAMLTKSAIFASLILAVQAVVYYTGSGKEVIPQIAPWSQFPAAMGVWQSGGDVPIEQDVLDQLKPDDYVNRVYASNTNLPAVSLFIGYFNSRRNGRAPHSPEWCLPGAGWKSISTQVISVPIPNDPEALPANEYLIEKGLDRQLVLYWYHQGSRSVASEVLAQMYSLPDLIMHGRTDTALVRIIVPVQSGNTAAAKTIAVGFAQNAYPLIRKHIL